jgi:hypothetical protein
MVTSVCSSCYAAADSSSACRIGTKSTQPSTGACAPPYSTLPATCSTAFRPKHCCLVPKAHQSHSCGPLQNAYLWAPSRAAAACQPHAALCCKAWPPSTHSTHMFAALCQKHLPVCCRHSPCNLPAACITATRDFKHCCSASTASHVTKHSPCSPPSACSTVLQSMATSTHNMQMCVALCLQPADLCNASTAFATCQHHAGRALGFQALLLSIHSSPCHSPTACCKAPTCALQAQPLQPAGRVQQEGQLRLISRQHQAAVV